MERKRISPTFDIETYNQIRALAHKEGKDMSVLVRDWAVQGLNGTLTKNNIDVIVPIIRSQLKSVLNHDLERIIKLLAKTCVQSGSAAYLSAQAISDFIPLEKRQNFNDCYEAARKKAVKYMKGTIEEKL